MHIASTSPAINAGIALGNDKNGNPISGTQDIDNQTRIIGGTIDIGADEYDATTMIAQNPVEYNGIKISPNPAKNNITIEIPQIVKEITLTISNINGKELTSQQIRDSTTQIDISNLASGIYFVKLITEKTVEVRKIIKE
jgi:hypothetical protein